MTGTSTMADYSRESGAGIMPKTAMATAIASSKLLLAP